jgi:hypothetical protein
MRWAEHATRPTKWLEHFKGRPYLRDLYNAHWWGEGNIKKGMLEKPGVRLESLLVSINSKQGPMAGFCEHSKEPSNFNQLRNH